MAVATLMRTSSRRRGLVIGILVVCMATIAIPVFANHSGLPGSNFEIEDGNLKVDGSGSHIDWLNVSEAGAADLATGQQDDSFGEGTKEADAVPTVVDGGIPNNKSDLKNFGVYAETVGSSSFLHMFWTRVQEPNGTTNMDFEFNQNTCVAGNGAGCSSNHVTPIRLPGDLLITYNLSKGGDVPSLFLHRWITSGSCEDAQEGGGGSNSGAPCWGVGVDLSASGAAEGSINGADIPATETGGLGALSARTFGEASINLASVFGNQCFALGAAYLKSRSSDTFTSALKDFIKPIPFQLSNCGSIKIIKKDDAGAFVAGAKFKLYKDDGDGIFEPGGQDVQVGGECTTTSDGTGNCIFNNLIFGNYWVDETFLPPGYDPDPVDPKFVMVTSTTQVVINFVNPRQPASVTIKKVDDAGNTLAGAVFTLFTDNAPFGPGTPRQANDTITSFSCTTPANGICTISNVLPAGKYWVVETTTPPGYQTAPDQWIELALGQNLNLTTTPFVNPRLHKVIVIVCHLGTNTLTAVPVTSGSQTKNSTTTNPSGVNLCDTGGATFSGYSHADDPSFQADIGGGSHP